MEKIVVTRHRGLVAYLLEKKLITKHTKVIPHAEPSDLKGKHVIGILPYRLAVYAAKYTEIYLRLPKEKRNVELTIEDFKWYAKEHQTYIITSIPFNDKLNAKDKILEQRRQKLRDLQVDEHIIDQILKEEEDA